MPRGLDEYFSGAFDMVPLPFVVPRHPAPIGGRMSRREGRSVAQHEVEFGFGAAGGVIGNADGEVLGFECREPIVPAGELVAARTIWALVLVGVQRLLT